METIIVLIIIAVVVSQMQNSRKKTEAKKAQQYKKEDAAHAAAKREQARMENAQKFQKTEAEPPREQPIAAPTVKPSFIVEAASDFNAQAAPAQSEPVKPAVDAAPRSASGSAAPVRSVRTPAMGAIHSMAFDAQTLRKMVIAREILDRPVSMRPRRNGGVNR